MGVLTLDSKLEEEEPSHTMLLLHKVGNLGVVTIVLAWCPAISVMSQWGVLTYVFRHSDKRLLAKLEHVSVERTALAVQDVPLSVLHTQVAFLGKLARSSELYKR